MEKPKIFALSASLRNARWGRGAQDLLAQIRAVEDRDALKAFVAQEAHIHFQQFLDAGREDGIPFDDLYKNLRKMAGKKGLCNSEVGMVVALWGAHMVGCDIDYLPLSSFFGPRGKAKNLDALKTALLECDGLLLCTPVYFGDRSSLASDFIEFVRSDADLASALAGRPMAGVAVGAKRNGGQETTLIYQLMEMTGIGMLGLGNDSETTSQYGGTIHAGDVGTAAKDDYGLGTSIGTGRRLGRVAQLLQAGNAAELNGRLKVMFWVLQDADGVAKGQVERLVADQRDRIDAQILEIVEGDVGRCIACDICPTHVGKDAEYRCIIVKSSDEFVSIHESMLDHDLIVPVVYSPRHRESLTTVYQRFIERTRYLRRGDYLFTDVLVMPLLVEEVGASENMNIRMLTSLIRHHTVVVRGNVGYEHQGKLLNGDEMIAEWRRALDIAGRLTVGRLVSAAKEGPVAYNPVGYVLSAAKDREASVAERRRTLHADRDRRRLEDSNRRLVRGPG